MIVVFTISVDSGLLILESCFVTIEGYLFDVFAEIGKMIIAVYLEELNEFFFFER